MTDEIFQVHKIGLWQIFQLSIVVLSRKKCYYQSHWMRNFRFSSTYLFDMDFFVF